MIKQDYFLRSKIKIIYLESFTEVTLCNIIVIVEIFKEATLSDLCVNLNPFNPLCKQVCINSGYDRTFFQLKAKYIFFL